MPWKETGVVNLRTEFVLRALSGKGTFEELCREYGISRKTGYKWQARFLAEGVGGLEDQSRRPQRSPAQSSEDLVCELVRLKQAHRSWGPRKIRTVYGRLHPELELPSESTCKRILEKAGLVAHRRRDIALEVEGSSSGDVVSQQAALDAWRTTYNHERPHEALGMRVPAELYAPSPRKYEEGSAVDYPLGYLRRRVTNRGAIGLHGVQVQISEALCGQEVGLEPQGERYALWFCRLRLGEVDVLREKFYAASGIATSGELAAAEAPQRVEE